MQLITDAINCLLLPPIQSIQQLDLLTFHNQRLTKRIESLQDASKAVSDVKSFVPSTVKL